MKKEEVKYIGKTTLKYSGAIYYCNVCDEPLELDEWREYPLMHNVCMKVYRKTYSSLINRKDEE